MYAQVIIMLWRWIRRLECAHAMLNIVKKKSQYLADSLMDASTTVQDCSSPIEKDRPPIQIQPGKYENNTGLYWNRFNVKVDLDKSFSIDILYTQRKEF